MNTTINTKLVASALGAAAAAVAVPAALFFGAGTAQALNPASNGHLFVTYSTDPLGLVANIRDTWNKVGETETCSYQSVGTGLTPPIPFYGETQVNGPANGGPVVIPGIPTGATWNVTVNCAHGGNFSFSEVY
jgi:hypothetical protein